MKMMIMVKNVLGVGFLSQVLESCLEWCSGAWI